MLKPFADSSHLGVELLQQVPGSHGLLFGFTLLVLEPIQQGSEVLDFAAEHQHPSFVVPQRALQFVQMRKTSRNSRFMESGPSARCLPPVTVTL